MKELSSWDFANTVQIPDGYDRKSVPEATCENMEILMNKINELIKEVNFLKEQSHIQQSISYVS